MLKPKKHKSDAQLAQEVEQHRPRLLSKIRRSIQDQFEAEDILQDVFEEFTQASSLGTTIESISAWLMTVANNKIRIVSGARRPETSLRHAKRINPRRRLSGTIGSERSFAKRF